MNKIDYLLKMITDNSDSEPLYLSHYTPTKTRGKVKTNTMRSLYDKEYKKRTTNVQMKVNSEPKKLGVNSWKKLPKTMKIRYSPEQKICVVGGTRVSGRGKILGFYIINNDSNVNPDMVVDFKKTEDLVSLKGVFDIVVLEGLGSDLNSANFYKSANYILKDNGLLELSVYITQESGWARYKNYYEGRDSKNIASAAYIDTLGQIYPYGFRGITSLKLGKVEHLLEYKLGDITSSTLCFRDDMSTFATQEHVTCVYRKVK